MRHEATLEKCSWESQASGGGPGFRAAEEQPPWPRTLPGRVINEAEPGYGRCVRLSEDGSQLNRAGREGR